jgi:CO/xanthine dehydrogenase FAD-binding subunit
MKPARFRYYRARSLDEALAFISGGAAGAKLLAGGQSLIPLLNLRLARAELLIDLNGISGLSYIRSEGGEIVMGALTRHREMEFSTLLSKALPLLAEAIPQIGHPAIRNRGTLGGSLAHADPAAELACVLTALDAKIVAASPYKERVIPVEEFFVSDYTTVLAEKEILKEVRIPLEERPAGWSFMEFSRRYGDFALAEASVVLLSSNSSGRCTSARVVIGGSVERPLRVRKVEQLLSKEVHLSLSRDSLTELRMEAGRLAATEIQSSGSARQDSEYLRNLSSVLVGRALGVAVDRWQSQ